MELYAYKFKPIFKSYLWGGRKLKDVLGKPIPDDTITAESWELADLPGDKSVIANGPLAGKTINEVIKTYGKTVTGSNREIDALPLLIKLLDAEDILSVQVHPDEDTCRRMGKGEPKTECWYIIDAEADSYIYKGLRPGTTREQFEAAIRAGKCDECLAKVPVKAGECHFLPAGTVHAIGAGLIIAEIQQPSNTTYRVFDWNRVDSRTGKPRELHIEEALESVNYNQNAAALTVKNDARLVDANEFKVDKINLGPNQEQYIMAGELEVYVAIRGKGKVITYGSDDAPETEYAGGDTMLMPADMIGSVAASENTEMLKVTIPDILK